MRHVFLICAIVLAGVGCAAHPTTITAEPDGVFVNVNGNGIGLAPVSYTFDFGKSDTYAVKGTKAGYFDAVVTVNDKTPLEKRAAAGIAVGCLLDADRHHRGE